MEKTISSINGVGKTTQSHVKEWNWIPILQHVQKLTQNGLKTFIVWTETRELLGENIGTNLFGIDLGDAFLDFLPNAKAIKAKINM